ncbi:hypothetical protein BABINDRAFT_159268 [Babjeviella inositovora NRRL Y-12698]|uniref:Uncharacterized protein n=1 Tax=Babjeviella inositovora NRRL Y-12698 TaxID=984486 RepID=A0A1E3QYL3_9ASCO|nr:uncharacterized protein BABINDRAFT_159268 [Babjeviella inositovora NRRL Y-12698]ODQ82753.1 hypothetical protein BABINDRAFT_159268 [Babjeviella inositovora NRRL Y-12698]
MPERYSPDIEKNFHSISQEDSSASINEANRDELPRIGRCTTSDDGEWLYLGDQRFRRDEIQTAFGGTLNTGLRAAPSRKFANVAPMGLAAFSIPTMCMAFVNLGATGGTNISALIGAAFFLAGMVEILAGMWEVVMENTFGATVFTIYGAFWLSYGSILCDSFGIIASYKSAAEFDKMMGSFCAVWALFSFLAFLCTLKTTVSFCGQFLFITLMFIVFTVVQFTQSPGWTKTAGVIGLITSLFGFYNMFAGMVDTANSYILLRPIFMPGAEVPRAH